MPEGHVLEFSGVTKRFGAVTAVDAFSARVEPGQVTGFLGPNGAGKTTTLRILLGLVQATSGSATIDGVAYSRLRDPLRTVGAVLEASSFHPGRTGANHLKVYAQAAGLPDTRVDDALGMVGLAEVGGRKVGGYSLGMRQRLGLAYALLGDPGVLVLDEPANGLDPEGIKWMRGLLRELARQGRTVLVSSHLLAEVQQTVDSLLIIAQGRLVFQGALHELTDPTEYATVVDSPDRAALAGALRAAGIDAEVLRSGLVVRGVDTVGVGAVAAQAGIVLSGLQRRGPALEEVFLDLVNGVRVHESATASGPVAAPAVVEDASPASSAADEAQAPAESEPAPPVADEPAAPVDEAAADAADGAAESVDLGGAAGFVVASTGIIDIVPAPEPEREAETESEAEPAREADAPSDVTASDASVEVAETGDAGAVETAPAGPAVALPRREWWVPAEVKPLTGAVEVAAAETEEAETEEADAEVQIVDAGAASEVSEGDAIEEIDADLEQPDSRPGGETEERPADPDRPWQEYVKTDSDVEADRFFAAFDDGTGPAPETESSADAEGEASGAETTQDTSPESDPGEADADADREGHDQEEGDQR